MTDQELETLIGTLLYDGTPAGRAAVKEIERLRAENKTLRNTVHVHACACRNARRDALEEAAGVADKWMQWDVARDIRALAAKGKDAP